VTPCVFITGNRLLEKCSSTTNVLVGDLQRTRWLKQTTNKVHEEKTSANKQPGGRLTHDRTDAFQRERDEKKKTRNATLPFTPKQRRPAVRAPLYRGSA
ncbi:hypothetical protein BaRGS_00010454, partial [Batillaria attramentaria]